MIRIVASSVVGGAARLESLALAIFGAGDRPPGWFATKLRAGCIEDRLSQVAVDDAHDIRSPRAWRGYVLVGAPPSRAPLAVTSGTGVVADARTRGIGRRLLDAAAAAAGAAGLEAIELVAAVDRVGFYRAAGFDLVHDVVTLQARGTADDTGATPPATPPATQWRADDPGLVLRAQTTPEAWAAAGNRVTVHDPVAGLLQVARVSPHGRAWIVHRWLSPGTAGAADVAAALRGRFAPGDTLLLPLCPAVSWITENLVPKPFSVAQGGALLRRPTPAPSAAAGPCAGA